MKQTSTNTSYGAISYWLPIGGERGSRHFPIHTHRTSHEMEPVLSAARHLPVLVPCLCLLPLHPNPEYTIVNTFKPDLDKNEKEWVGGLLVR
jgi:hypothetical protein